MTFSPLIQKQLDDNWDTWLAEEQLFLQHDEERYLDFMSNKPLADRYTYEERRNGAIIFNQLYKAMLERKN